MITTPRLVAIAMILVLSTIAWFVLGGSVDFRTNHADSNGRDAVSGLWGSPQTQLAPTFTTGTRSIGLASSDVAAAFELEQRKKGLLWYATYGVALDATYQIENPLKDKTAPVRMRFAFPDPDGVYDGFHVVIDGKDADISYSSGEAIAEFTLEPGASATIQTGYRSQGLDEWRYAPTRDGVGVIENFELTMSTDFDDVDFPSDAVSPTSKTATEGGWVLTWAYDSLVSGRQIGLTMPKPLNPGPVASRISFFAPVSLLFYFAALILTGAIRSVRVHHMNFGFLAAGFFAFHLLFSYLVDRIDIGVAFGIASTTSVALCVGYLRLVVHDRRALIELAVSQLIFLVLFSFSFFFEGLTGLAVTIGSVLTLAYFMAKTGHIDWEAAFAKGAAERQRRATQPPTPPSPSRPTPPVVQPTPTDGTGA